MDWNCNQCSKAGEKFFVFASKDCCPKCHGNRPKKPLLYGSGRRKPATKGGGEGTARNEEAKRQRREREDPCPLRKAAAKAKEVYLEFKKVFKDDSDEHAAAVVQRTYDEWQEAEKKAKSIESEDEDIEGVRHMVAMLEGQPQLAKHLALYRAKLEKLESTRQDSQPKVIRDIKHKLEMLRKLPASPDVAETIRSVEKQLEQAKGSGGGKTPSDELRSAEARRANKAKHLEAAQSEAEDFKKQQVEIAAKLAAKETEIDLARQALDEADIDMVEKRRAVAHPLPGTHIADAQVAAVSTQVAAYQTLLYGARDTVTKPEVATRLPPEVKTILDALYDGFIGVHAVLPPEFRKLPQTAAPPEPAIGEAAAGNSSSSASGGTIGDEVDADLEIIMRS